MPDFGEIPEDIHVQNLVPVSSIEALYVGVLGRRSRLDELQCYAVLFSPIRQGDGDELGAVIHAQFGGIASPGDDAFQYPNDPRGREVQINLYGQDLPVKVVHHVERPEASATE